MIDFHSHILPGIDDGARDFEESVLMVRALASEGFSTILATPHYINGTEYVSPRKQNEALIRKLQKAVRKFGVKLVLCNEIYIDEGILDLISKGLVRPVGKSRFLLVELPLSGRFPNYRDILLELIQEGYTVVLAHPERYTAFQDDFSLISELYEMGVLMQCNLGSILGKYGRSARRKVRKMAKEDLIFMFGSDAHRVFQEGYFKKAVAKFTKIYGAEKMNELMVLNPSKLTK